jgi:hypothetical protein
MRECHHVNGTRYEDKRPCLSSRLPHLRTAQRHPAHRQPAADHRRPWLRQDRGHRVARGSPGAGRAGRAGALACHHLHQQGRAGAQGPHPAKASRLARRGDAGGHVALVLRRPAAPVPVSQPFATRLPHPRPARPVPVCLYPAQTTGAQRPRQGPSTLVLLQRVAPVQPGHRGTGRAGAARRLVRVPPGRSGGVCRRIGRWSKQNQGQENRQRGGAVVRGEDRQQTGARCWR